ncbi:tetratricopeptide repeat protein [Polaribacter sp. Asnod1-A03]|uniref:tetratricopeptide repeat protein n=1 Tax=Polaribacter sp. Asnod1-A03 TaxID=3160581 RepID=UPI003869CAB5
MKKLLIVIFLVANLSFSQEKLPFIDYDSIILKASNEESTEKKLELINKIHKNDSAYNSLLVSKSYYLLTLSKYKEALEVANEGLSNITSNSKSDFYTNKGVALINLGENDKALENYNEALKMYPKNYLLWYNKGYVLEIKGELNKAVEAYKKAITLNPTYKKPHLQIGNIFYKQERLTQALMCFNMYLLLEPDAEGAFATLQSLNNVVQSKNASKRDATIKLNDADDSFEDIDLVLNSKIAMNANYQTGNPINIALARQNHAMIEQLKDFKGKGSFWDKTYIPLYNWIAENNKFDDFIYTLTYSIENKDFKKIVDKKEKEIVAFLAELKQKWAEITAVNTIVFNGKKQEVTYEYSENYVDAIGKFKDDEPIGFWQFYNENGMLTAEGNFNNSGEKIGKWTWYSGLNQIKETAYYKNGLLDGKNEMFYKNNKKYVNAIYKNDSLNGKYEYFNDKGALEQRKYFKSGELEGDYKSYFKVGEKLIEFEIPYKKGEIDGEVLEYYATGNLYAKSYYVAGKKFGIETVYHNNKQISSEINYQNGELNGTYKSFHINGKLKEIGQSLEGFYNGPWKTYYVDGTLESEFNYDKGEFDGLYKYYDTDGKLFYEYVYRKGEIIAYTFYNKDATILKEGKKKGGEFYYQGFSPKGNITAEGLYDISGGKSGEWKFYDNNGVLTNKGVFKENKTMGEYFTYFKNGEIDNITTYKNDVIDGYYVGYHINGQMATQGWYKEGNAHGEWRYYNIDGNLHTISFYHKGKLHGTQKYYSVDGKLKSTILFNFDDIIFEDFYDKEGNLFEKIDYVSKKEEYKLYVKHFNGKIDTEVTYVNQVKHGSYKVFYYNGNKKIEGSYLNGEQNGRWTWYYENGDVESAANFSRGNTEGKVINYHENGKIQGDYYFENDLEVGTSITYYNTGIKSAEIKYYQGKIHGKKTIYDETGKVQLIRFYNHGEIIGYSYLGKNGTEIDMIPLERETGNIKAFFDNGKPSVITEYKFGSLVNSFKSYNYNGNLENDTPYLNGKYHGVDKEYFLNGKLKKETNYSHGKKQGKQIVYLESGKKKEEKMFVNDIQHGMSFFYDDEGKLKTRKEYFNEKIYKIENL